MACINSVGDNFPDTEIKGCFFHFSQAIYRKILEFGYAVQYRKDKDFNLAIRFLAALAFAPPLHVEAWYKQILVTSTFLTTSRIILRTPLKATKCETRQVGNRDSTWICGTFTSGPLTTSPEQTMPLKDSTVDSNPCSKCQFLKFGSSLRQFRGSNHCNLSVLLKCSSARKSIQGKRIILGGSRELYALPLTTKSWIILKP